MSSFWSSERISDYLDDRLSVEERARVEEHLRNNPADQAQLVEFTEMQQALRNAPRYELDSGFTDRVLGAIAKSVQTDPAGMDSEDLAVNKSSADPPRPSTTNWRYTASMIAALAAILLLSAFLLPNNFRPDEMARLNSSTDAQKITADAKAPSSPGEGIPAPDSVEGSLDEVAVDSERVAEDAASMPSPPRQIPTDKLSNDSDQRSLETGLQAEDPTSGMFDSSAGEKNPGVSRARGKRLGSSGSAAVGDGSAYPSDDSSIRGDDAFVTPQMVMVILPEQNRNQIENLEKRLEPKKIAGFEMSAKPQAGLTFGNKETQATEEQEADEDVDLSEQSESEEETRQAQESLEDSQGELKSSQLAFFVDATEDQLQGVLDSINATRVQNRDEFIELSKRFQRSDDAEDQPPIGANAADIRGRSTEKILSGELLQGVVIQRVESDLVFPKSTTVDSEPTGNEQKRAYGGGVGFDFQNATPNAAEMSEESQQQGDKKPRRRYLLVIQIVPNDAASVTPPPADQSPQK